MFELDSGWSPSGEIPADTPIFNALQQRRESYLVSDMRDVDLLDQVPSPRTDPLAEFRRDPLAAPVPAAAYVEVPAPSTPRVLRPARSRAAERGTVRRLPAERVPAERVPAERGPVSRFPKSVIDTPAMTMVRPWEADLVPVQAAGRHRNPASERTETTGPAPVIPAPVIPVAVIPVTAMSAKRAPWPHGGY